MSTPFHVLIIDDSGKDALLVERTLRKEWPGLLADRVETGEALREALEKQGWDCVLCDMVIPGFSADEALDSIRKVASDLPFIIVSGVVHIEDVVSLLKKGAHDFVRKDDLARLIPTINKALEEVKNQKRQYQTELKLRESEERYRLLIEQSPFSILILGLDGRIQQVNAAYQKLWGLDDHELETLLRKYNIFEDPELIKSGVVQLAEKVLEGEYVSLPSFEYDTSSVWKQFGIPDVTPKKSWVNCRAYPVNAADGSILSAILVLEDVTSQVKNEQALTESETNFRAFTNQSVEGISAADLDGNYTFVNPAFCNMVGWSEQELLQMTVFDVKAPGQDHSSFEKTKSENEGTPFEVRLARKDGSEFLAEITGKTLSIRGRQSVLRTVRDITERKNAEEELRQYAHIVSSSDDMLALLDNNFVYLAANDAYLEAFEKHRDELLGHTVADIFGSEFFNETIKPNADRCLEGQNVRFQNWFEFPGTGRRYMDVSYSAYRGDDSRIKGFVVSARNISELLIIEEKLRESEEKFSRAFHSHSTPMQILNLETGERLEINQR